MRNRAVSHLLILASLFSGAVRAELCVLQPAESLIVDQSSAEPELAPVRTGSLYESIQRIAGSRTLKFVLALDERARQLSGSKDPVCLLLAREDGGFARTGYWRVGAEGREFINAPYIDMVVDDASLVDGSFEETFAHEMGHVLLGRVFPNLPDGYSRTPHRVTALTDRVTAFDEGFAIHFQGLARAISDNRALTVFGPGNVTRPFVAFWSSSVESSWRVHGMQSNTFALQQLEYQGTAGETPNVDTSTLYDAGNLKSPEQMLASEGVVATFFYRFLVHSGQDDAQLIGRYERLLATLHKLSSSGKHLLASPWPLLVSVYAAENKSEANDIYGAFVETTYGAALDSELREVSQRLARVGRGGDLPTFVGLLEQARNRVKSDVESLVGGDIGASHGMGPEIWVKWPGKDVSEERRWFDVNTATYHHLVRAGVPEKSAARIIGVRAAGFPFTSIEDVVDRCKLAEYVAGQLREGARAALRDGPIKRY